MNNDTYPRKYIYTGTSLNLLMFPLLMHCYQLFQQLLFADDGEEVHSEMGVHSQVPSLLSGLWVLV